MIRGTWSLTDPLLPVNIPATMLKVGRTMGVGEVFVYSEGAEEPVAHSTMTYSIPPNR